MARTVLDRQQRHGRRVADRVRLERARLRRNGLPDARRRIQGPGAHRARRLRLSPAVHRRRRRLRSARSGVRPIQCLVRRARARAAHVLRERRRRARRRRVHLWLGELSGPRVALGRLLPACARRPQRDPDLSGRLPADHRARGHGLQRGGRRDLGRGRLGPRHLVDVRHERDAVRRREHAEPLDGHCEPDDVRRRRLLVRPARAQFLRRARIRRRRARVAAQRRGGPRGARGRRIRSSRASRARISTAACCCRAVCRRRRAHRYSRAFVRRT